MHIYRVTDSEFCDYGQVLDIDTDEIVYEAGRISMPASGSVYTASQPEFENLKISSDIRDKCFGELATQTGYCYGHSTALNALEWHKCSEINIAVTDMILLLGDIRDVKNGRYDSANVKAFLVKKGEAIEVYATTLHFCPIETSPDGFGCVVVLPQGTNLPLDGESKDKLLFRKNKWLIAHEDNAALTEKGVFPGIYGENYKF